MVKCSLGQRYQLKNEYLFYFFITAPFPFPKKSCRRVTHQNGIDRLDATLPFAPRSTFCRIVYPSAVPSSSRKWVIKVDMYNDGPLPGNGGIIYNVKDINNFQLVYLRYVIFCSIDFVIESISSHASPWVLRTQSLPIESTMPGLNVPK